MTQYINTPFPRTRESHRAQARSFPPILCAAFAAEIPAFAGMAKFFIALFFVFFLASCGGGGGGNPPTTETPTTVTMAMMDDDDTGDGNDSPTPPRPFDSSYYLTETGARFAHDAGYTGEGVTVYIDERLRHTHSAISANIISLTGECRIGLHNPFCNAFEIEPDNLERKSHGTGVAGILVNTAPDIRLVNPVDAIENAANYDVQIANHSQGIAWPDGLHITSSLAMITMNPTIIEFANRYAYAKDADIVWVDSNGNEGFNTLRGNPNAPAFFGALPYIVDGLEDNWLMVGSITTLTTTFDNGCGYAAMWCIMAFGETLSTANSGSDTEERHDFGRTSGATPQVAGALAVLKSAADDLHSGTEMTLMTNVRLILLNYATPLYAPSDNVNFEDERIPGAVNPNPVLSSVYGWGLVNISAGITHLRGIAGQMAAIEGMNIRAIGRMRRRRRMAG